MKATRVYYHLNSKGEIESTLDKKPEAMSYLNGYLTVNQTSLKTVESIKIEKFTKQSLNNLLNKGE